MLVRYSTATAPFAVLYLIAFDRRLMNTCFIRVRSALTKHGIAKREKTTLMPRFFACGSIIAWHSSITSFERNRLQ